MRKLNLLWLVGLCSCSMMVQPDFKDEFNDSFSDIMKNYVLHTDHLIKKFDIKLVSCDIEEVLEYKITDRDISFRTDRHNKIIKLDKINYEVCPLEITHSGDKVIDIDILTYGKCFIINNSFDKNYIFTDMSFDCYWNDKFKTIDVEDGSFFMFTTLATYSKIEAKKILNKTLDL